MQPLRFTPLDQFVTADGEVRELKDPDGTPTPRQFSALNRMGCLLVVEPGQAFPLTRADAAGAVAAARELAPEAPRGTTSTEPLSGGHPAVAISPPDGRGGDTGLPYRADTPPLSAEHSFDEDSDRPKTAQPSHSRHKGWA